MNDSTLKLSQSEYIDSMLKRFDMSDCNPVATLVDKGSHLQGTEMAIFKNEKLYQALTGSLTYAVMSTQPDIGYIMQYLSQLNKKPSLNDWIMAKRVLHYLKGTKDIRVMYKKVTKSTEGDLGHVTPWAFCDMNYSKDPCDRRSTSGYMFMLASGSITWRSKKKASITLSTMEAEYYALGIACQEAIWL